MTPAAPDPSVMKNVIMRKGIVMRLSVAAALCCLCTLSLAADPAKASIRKDANIPAESLGAALQTLATTYDFQVLYRTEIVQDLKTKGASGSLSPKEALGQVLNGTGLSYKYLDEKTVTVFPIGSLDSSESPSSSTAASTTSHTTGDGAQEGKKTSSTFRVAQVGRGQSPSDVPIVSQQEFTSLNEIVVTAQRREQNLQDVGIAITALSGAKLKDLNISTTSQLAQYTPGLFISASGGGQDSQFTIRGVTQNDFNEVAESPVAVYIDDTYVPNLSGQTFSFFDIKRVEVLKGPQGTLFGRNATGGLVQFVVNEPTMQPEGYADITYGSYNQVKVEGAASGPFAGDWTGRASVYYDRFDPYVKNFYPEGLVAGAGGPKGPGYFPFGQDVGNDDTLAGRVQLTYAPGNDLKIRITGSASHRDLSTGPYTEIPLKGTADAAGNETNSIKSGVADSFGYVPLTGHNTSLGFARSKGNITDAYDGAIHIDYKFGDINFVSVTDYKYNSESHETDIATGPTDVAGVVQPQKTSSFTQEIRFNSSVGPLAWTAGAYYLDRLTHNNFSFTIQPNSLLEGIYNSGAEGAFPTAFAKFRDHSESLFGQGEYAITDKWKVILGVRGVAEQQQYNYSAEAYLGDGDPYNPIFSTPIVSLTDPYSNRRTEHLWTGKAQLEYRPVDQVLAYIEFNRGVKAGGYNLFPTLTPTQINPATFAYQPEELNDYEAGLKTTVGFATINLSAFYYDYHNYQAFRFAGLSGTTVNDPATYYGGEADIAVQPTKGLEIELQASAVHARVKDVSITPTIFATVQPTFTPDFQAGAIVSYTFPWEVFGGKLNYGIEGHYTNSFYTDLRNFKGQLANGYFLGNMHLGWTDKNDRFSVTIRADNFTNKIYEVTGFDFSTFCGCGEMAYGPPRWYSAQVGYKF